MQRSTTDTKARIWDVYNIVLVVAVSMVNHEIMKLDPTKIGHKRKMHTSTYHQWIYSFKNRKKYQTKRMAVIITVMIPMATAPHLIGKHPQHEDSLVNSFAQTQSQQQHGSIIGSAYGSVSSTLFFFSSSFFSDFSDLGFSDLGFSDFGASDFGLSSAPSSGAASSLLPPSRRLSYSLN